MAARKKATRKKREPEACVQCRYLVKSPERNSLGLCVRFPKSEYKNQGDWCGEFESAQKGQKHGQV